MRSDARTLTIEDLNVDDCRFIARRPTHVMPAVGEFTSLDRQSTDERLWFNLLTDLDATRHARFERYAVAEPVDVMRCLVLASGVARDLDRLKALDELVSAHRHRCKQTYRQVE